MRSSAAAGISGIGFAEPTIFVAAPAVLKCVLYGNGPAHPLGPAEEPQHLVRGDMNLPCYSHNSRIGTDEKRALSPAPLAQ